jgi:Protein of unknown function (DUF4199)
MSLKLSPAIKGLITAALMIAVMLFIYSKGNEAPSWLQFLVYGIYGLGIVWTLLSYRNSEASTGRFVDNFSQGFRCFVIVVLAMALFYWIFNLTHPELATDSAALYRKELVANPGDLMPADIDERVSGYKKRYTITLVYGAIIGYLIIGAGITAVTSVLLIRRT